MPLPWRTLSSRTLLADRWINVRADHCQTPGGKDITPYYVLTYPEWVHVAALTPDNQLILVEQYRHGAHAVCLELPGGAVDAADACLQAAADRELREETGYAATAWQHVSSLYANPATQTNRVHFLLATGCHRLGEPDLEAGEEGLSLRLMPAGVVRAGLPGGLIGPAMQVAGLLLALDLAGLNAAR